MELVNKKYVKMHKFDIFTEMVNAGATEKEQDDEKVAFFQKMLNVVMEYERSINHRTPIEEFYVSVDDIDIEDADVTRQTIINALVYASITKDFHMVKEITPYLYCKRYKVVVGNDVLDYILEHGMDTDTFIDGEEEKLIYHPNSETLEYGYIHNHSVKLERRKK